APRDVRAARTWWSLVAATALVAAAVAIWRPWQARTTAQLIRLSTELSAGVNAIIGLGASAVLSPDGTVVAFVGGKSRADGADSIQLFVRRTDQLEAAALPGTERGRVPFFSPDGQWIAFFSDGKLKKTPTAGGAVVTVADVAQLPRGGAWGENGTIVLAGGRV